MKKSVLVIIFITGILICLLAFYLFLLYPIICSDIRNEPISVDYTSWRKYPLDSLGLYYLERSDVPSFNDFLENTEDSIFVKNYGEQKITAITFKEPNKYIVHFTNNITQKTLRSYSYYLRTDNSLYLKLFIKNVDWLTQNATIINDTIAVWKNNDIIPDKYNLEFGWISAFSQGFGLSVLSRAYQLTSNMQYVNLAEKILNSYALSYKEGGISYIDNEGNTWFFEYPSEPPAYVLNGFIFSLFGLYDYYRITGSEKALAYFNEGVKTIEKNLWRYDSGFWSRYDLMSQHFAGFNYHKNVHIPQLYVLSVITGNEIFSEYAAKFEKYLHEPYFTVYKIAFSLDALERALTYKNPLKLLFK